MSETTYCGRTVDGAPFYADKVCGEDGYQCIDCIHLDIANRRDERAREEDEAYDRQIAAQATQERNAGLAMVERLIEMSGTGRSTLSRITVAETIYQSMHDANMATPYNGARYDMMHELLRVIVREFTPHNGMRETLWECLTGHDGMTVAECVRSTARYYGANV